MSNNYCSDCVYSYSVNGMQACVWDEGLMNRRKKCDRYKKSWGKTLRPIVMFFLGCYVVISVLLALGL